MRRTLMTRIITLGLLLAMMLSIASCGKKGHGKVGRKIAPEDPWFDAKTYNIDPGLDTGGKEIEYKQQKLAGADDKYIVVFSNGNYAQPDNNADYDSRDYSYYLVTVVDRNTGNKICTIYLNQYLSENGFVANVEYLNGTITSKIYNYEGDRQVVVEVDNDVLTGKKLEERDLGEYDGSGESRRFSAGKYTILANSIFDYSSYEQYYIPSAVSCSRFPEKPHY